MKLYDVRAVVWVKVRAHSAQEAQDIAYERVAMVGEVDEITDCEEDYPDDI